VSIKELKLGEWLKYSVAKAILVGFVGFVGFPLPEKVFLALFNAVYVRIYTYCNEKKPTKPTKPTKSHPLNERLKAYVLRWQSGFLMIRNSIHPKKEQDPHGNENSQNTSPTRKSLFR
jgi:hypothetical protein